MYQMIGILLYGLFLIFLYIGVYYLMKLSS
jgi:hypothetical protein